MSNFKSCIACNNSKTSNVDVTLEGEALEMFNFVCCLEISQPEESQGICTECNEELRVSFNFKKRCLEIFANVYEHPNPVDESEHESDEGLDDIRWDSLMGFDQTLDEGTNTLSLNDLLIPEVCFGSSALSVLDVSDNTKCRYCFTEYDTKEECLKHMEIHKGDDKPYKCPQEGCASSFKARKNLKDHYLVHSNERPFPCHFCNQTFKSSSNRSKHERRIHSKERNAMRIANAQTQEIAKLAEMQKAEEEPQPTVKKEKEEPMAVVNSLLSPDDEDRVFRCEHEGCTSSFKTRSSLRDHQKVHSDERPYPCNFCSSAFKSSSNRSKHERGSHPTEYQKRKRERENPTNTNGKADDSPSTPKKQKLSVQTSPKVIKPTPKKTEHPCRYCDRVFSRGDRRDTHETTHKDIRAFDCGFCSKNFKTQEALRQHMKIHTDTKLSCSFEGCEAIYTDRRSLKEHESSAHTIQGTEYVCEEENCGKVYSSPKALRNHKKMKHNDDDNQLISCDLCSMNFRRKEIAQHLLIHM